MALFSRKPAQRNLDPFAQWQQGDVIGRRITAIPKAAKIRKKKDSVLAHGEVTGHAHRLAEATDGLLYEAEDGTLYLTVGPKGTTITHEEHKPVTLPQGVYEIGKVREYDHFQEEMREVRD